MYNYFVNIAVWPLGRKKKSPTTVKSETKAYRIHAIMPRVRWSECIRQSRLTNTEESWVECQSVIMYLFQYICFKTCIHPDALQKVSEDFKFSLCTEKVLFSFFSFFPPQNLSKFLKLQRALQSLTLTRFNGDRQYYTKCRKKLWHLLTG